MLNEALNYHNEGESSDEEDKSDDNDGDKQDPTDLHIDELDFTLKGSVTGSFIEQRYSENRDAKIIITSKGSTTGLGKSTLGIVLCYFADAHDWTADEKGFVDVNDYVKKYKQVPEHSALLIDEIEHGADSRRAMTNENVNLSHAWATLRYRNVISVATLPSVSMLDKRLMELADLWINVVEKGKAIPHYLTINDYTGKLERYQLNHPRTGDVEVLTWPPLNNADYRNMQSKKDKKVRVGEEAKTYDKKDLDKARKKAKKEKRNEMIREFYNADNLTLSQADIADVVDLSQTMVGNITKES